jgi:glycosyltransferase involved in cell wall biosynthesis
MANILFINANMGKPEMHKSSGGAIRTMALIEALKDHNVTFFSFGWDTTVHNYKVNDNLTYVYPGVEPRAIQMKNRIMARYANNPDLCVQVMYKDLKQARKKFQDLLVGVDLVILEHYSGAPFLNEVTDIPIIYSSQNCEIFMANQIFGEDSEAAKVTRQMEEFAISKADALMYCSGEDLVHLEEYYGIGCPAYYVPNGADKKGITRPDIRKKSKNIFFVGSGHPPNIVAANAVIPIARLMPEYTFTLCGSASNGVSVKKQLVPDNVQILGKVSDEELDMIFRDSFAFINPMETGSGTHLKMMEALSYGIPIITSTVGARGFSQEDKNSAMIVADGVQEMIDAIAKLEDVNNYSKIVEGTQKAFKSYDWDTVKTNFAYDVEQVIGDVETTVKEIINDKKESVLIYSIVRNIETRADVYYQQIKSIVEKSPDYDFYLSIYENDSTDKTKQLLFSKDWSFFSGVSIITENINTKFYGSVKDATRVENLAKARNKAIEAGGFLDKVDYILMIEGDNRFKTQAARELLNFKNVEPDFDVVSSVSIRPSGTHYDWWATRTSPIFNPTKSELDPQYKQKDYGKYYSTSNGLCLYRAKPFQEGIRHGWINNVTNEFDCEMVVVCQNLRDAGYNNIYINYKALSFH